MALVRLGLAVAVLLAANGRLVGQLAAPGAAGAQASPPGERGGVSRDLLRRLGPDSLATDLSAPGTYFVLSGLVPGWGQFLLEQSRWTPYAALEGWAWLQFLDRRREGRRLERRYRDLAWMVARRDLAAGARVDGSFDYYEAMSQYRRSGLFDRDPVQPGVQPEEDPDTYNGSVWLLARQMFLGSDSTGAHDPSSVAYQKALEYYRSRAYSPQMAWDWGPFALHWMEYRDLIRASDESLRRATNFLGLILGNHLLSAVDALVSARLRGLGGGGSVELQTFLLSPPDPAWSWLIQVRVSPGGRR